MKPSMKKLYGATDWITFILELNVAIVLGTICGCIVLGIGPSLQAGHHMAKLRHQQKSMPFFKTFCRYYKKVFKSANLIMVPVEFIYILPLGLILKQNGADLSRGFAIVLLISLVLVVMTLLTLFPMYEFYQLKTNQYFVSALRFISYNPIGCLLALLATALCVYLITLFPGVTLFIFGVAVYLNMGLYLRFFEQNEEKVQKTQQEEKKSLKGALEK